MSGIVAAGYLILRRARRDLLALLGVLVLTAVAAALALAVPLQIEATLDRAAEEAVAAAGSDADLLLRSSVADPSGYETTTAGRLLDYAAELPERLPAALTGVASGIHVGILGPELPATAPRGGVLVRLGVLDPAESESLRVASGALPGDDAGEGPADVAVSSATAAATGLEAGDVLPVAQGPALRVVAVVDAVDPTGEAWTDLPGLWQPASSSSRGGAARPAVTVLTTAATLDRVGPLLPEAALGTARVVLDPARFDLERERSAGLAIDALETSTADITEGAPLTVTALSGYEEALDAFPAAVSAATAQLSTLAAGLLGVAVLVAVLASTALSGRRHAEIALLRSHGATLGLIGTHAAVESLLVTALGCTAAALVVPPRSPALMAVAAAVLVVSPVVATLRPLLRPLPAPRRRALRLAAAGVLVAAALTAVLALRGGSGASGVDPLALVAPVLAAAVIALALSPLPALAAAPLVRLAGRSRGPAALLAGSSAQEGTSRLALVAVVLAASAAVASTVLLQTVASGQESASWRAVGADLRIDTAPDGPALAAELDAAGDTAAALARIDGVRAEGPTSQVTATVLGVDSDYARLLAALPPEALPSADPPAIPPSGAPAADDPLPVLVDRRLASTVGDGSFVLDIDGVRIDARVAGPPIPRAEWVGRPVAVVDRALLAEALGGEPAAATVLAVGPVASAEGAVLRSSVLADSRDGALVSGVRDATLLSLLATGLLAVLAVLATAVLGARRRGGTLALLRALGLPDRARLALAVGELVPLVLGGVVGGVLAAAVVLTAAWPAFGVDTLVGGPAAVSVPLLLPLGVLAAAAAALALALAVDVPLSRRVRTADILRSGEEA
ncbi:FtsX-like permease family protein [Rathayibacter sp. VKM Ac-2801]|uniref:FtsX-like permease family protein n=1 Tax=Rathayibacter sp. VKM Ac-2801 TaxID=2609255 RepID=UPI00131F5996|nr:FtsX-like permease family protein [Rathayibacter sp. VKM Ac-2801]QHC69711.1 hypothetical protein GSU45_04495 [Rathayibacter sp. VKM Ac-2801]